MNASNAMGSAVKVPLPGPFHLRVFTHHKYDHLLGAVFVGERRVSGQFRIQN